MTRLQVFDTADELGIHLAKGLLVEIDHARAAGRQFLLGCPTGRTPRPIYNAMARQLSEAPRDLSHVVLVMMDEYVIKGARGFENASEKEPWSCHHFARAEILALLNRALRGDLSLPRQNVWFPDPVNPGAYDQRIEDAGGIDFFILASGASDGHVAFNPAGTPRDSRTRIIELSEQTRRDNLQTFPAFGTIEAVPAHGLTVGIATIVSARGAVMVLTGAGKRESLSRILQAEHYDPRWPATVIHEFAAGEILADREAAKGLG